MDHGSRASMSYARQRHRNHTAQAKAKRATDISPKPSPPLPQAVSLTSFVSHAKKAKVLPALNLTDLELHVRSIGTIGALGFLKV